MKKLITALLAIGFVSATPASAAIYLDFEGIAPYPNNNNVLIGGYYNGGTSSVGTSGTNYGVQFTTDAVLLCLNTAGTACSNTSKGGSGIASSAFGALYFPSSSPIMNVAAGFDQGFSFTYSAPFSSGTGIEIYSGLNGTGSLLASALLPLTGTGSCDTSISGGAAYCPFVSYSLGFSGTATSVKFTGTPNQQVFDDFTFGSTIVGGGTSAVPEPATWAMMIVGFGLVGGVQRRRRQNAAVTAFG